MLTGAKLQQKFQNIVIICHKNITFMFKKQSIHGAVWRFIDSFIDNY